MLRYLRAGRKEQREGRVDLHLHELCDVEERTRHWPVWSPGSFLEKYVRGDLSVHVHFLVIGGVNGEDRQYCAVIDGARENLEDVDAVIVEEFFEPGRHD